MRRLSSLFTVTLLQVLHLSNFSAFAFQHSVFERSSLSSSSSSITTTRTTTRTISSSSSLTLAPPSCIRLQSRKIAVVTRQQATKKSTDTATTTTIPPVENPEQLLLPERIIMEKLPIVYAYDHCHFCSRVRTALGMKNVKFTLVFLSHDDSKTPTKLVGKKMLPIFEFPEDDVTMTGSMDIVNFINNEERFGVPNILPATGRSDIKKWEKSARDLLLILQRPRYVATGLLPEFQQLKGRRSFIRNFHLTPYTKEEWKRKRSKSTSSRSKIKIGDETVILKTAAEDNKGDSSIDNNNNDDKSQEKINQDTVSDNKPILSMEEKLSAYEEAVTIDPKILIEELNVKLIQLDDILYSEYCCSKGGFSLDDIDLFSRLRSTTIVKGVRWPKKLRNYLCNISELADISLFGHMAL